LWLWLWLYMRRVPLIAQINMGMELVMLGPTNCPSLSVLPLCMRIVDNNRLDYYIHHTSKYHCTVYVSCKL